MVMSPLVASNLMLQFKVPVPDQPVSVNCTVVVPLPAKVPVVFKLIEVVVVA